MSQHEYTEEILDSYLYAPNPSITIVERKLTYNNETPFRCDIAVDTINKIYICSKDNLNSGYVDFFKDLSKFQPACDNDKVCTIAFNESENAWYGWSHRAIYGFKIGSQVKRGDCGYNPISKEDFIQSMINFFDLNGKVFNIENSPSQELNNTSYSSKFTYVDDFPDENMIELNYIFTRYNAEGEIFQLENNSIKCDLPTNYGRGEWTALTLDDAKQMAIDFARSVG